MTELLNSATEARLQKQLVTWLNQDAYRVQILHWVEKLNLPMAYVGAGFVRNMVWDRLHAKTQPTPLNDVDVIYFEADNLTLEQAQQQAQQYEQQLEAWMPQVRWQVKNQAQMHKRNGDRPYTSVRDAMSFWPEKETAVAVRCTPDGYEVMSAFGLSSLFALCVTYNPKRSKKVFEQRVRSKEWLQSWPKLTVVW